MSFLQESRCEPIGSNESLWSLSYEFWFYVTFAGSAVAVTSIVQQKYLKILGAIAMCVAVLLAFGGSLILLAPAWLLGVSLAEVQRRYPATRSVAPSIPALFILAAIFLASVSALRLLDLSRQAAFVVVGVAALPVFAALTTISLANASLRGILNAPTRLLAWIGGWSFTLYVFHLPLVVFIANAAVKWSIEPSPFTVYIVTIAILAMIYPIYFLAENHTREFQRILKLVIDHVEHSSRTILTDSRFGKRIR